MAEIWWRDDQDDATTRVTSSHPFPVKTVDAVPPRPLLPTAAEYNLSITGSVVPLTQSVYASAGGADRAIVTCETAQIRYTLDWTNPSTTLGHLLSAGDILILDGFETISRFRATRVTATSGTLMVSYEKYAVQSPAVQT